MACSAPTMVQQLVLSCLWRAQGYVPFRSLLAVAALVVAALPCAAHDKEAITDLSVPTNGGWVIEADAEVGNPTAGRDKIPVSATVDYTSAAAGIFKYRLGFRLRDASGAAHPIFDQNGRSNTVYYAYDTVGLLTAGKATRSYSAELRPANRLSPTNAYRAELTLDEAQNPNSNIYESTGTSRKGLANTYYHFTNQVSADTALNAFVTLDDASYTRTYLIDMADSGKDSFRLQVNFTVRRYDDFKAASVSEATIPVYVRAELSDADAGTPVPLQTSERLLSFPLVRSCDRSSAVPNPAVQSFGGIAQFRPQMGHQLNSVSRRYRLTLSLKHDDKSDAGPAWVNGNSLAMAPQQFLHFNGVLRFGDIESVFDSVGNDPVDDGTGVLGSFIGTRLGIRNQSGFLMDGSGYAYGDGALLDVKLLPNGDAELRSGGVNAIALGESTGEVQGIRFKRIPPVRLTPTGGKSDLRVYLPAGLGYATNAQALVLDHWLNAPSVLLGPGLIPASPVTNRDQLFYCKDTLPLRIETTRTVWEPLSGTFTLTPSAVSYVRAAELLRLQDADVEDPAMNHKRSNEQMFRFVDSVPGVIVVRADANGSARWSLDLALTPGEFTTHFPHNTQVRWLGPGVAEIQSDRFVPSRSFLSNAANVTVSYTQSCPSGDCPGVLKVGHIELKPFGERLAFTPDGGLAAAGTVVSGGELAWGALENNRFVHRTSVFEDASFAMPGSTLRGGSSTLDFYQFPGVLLLTGVDPTTHEATERPFNVAYGSGRADYAGVNLRVPAKEVTATSVIGGRATGAPYELAPNSKYYVRQSGVSGVHQAAEGAAPSNLLLYGYPAGFTTFGLSYLDSDNIDSRTDGYIAVPSPADFTLPMEGVRLTCLGDLGGPLLAGGTVTNHLEYWNADFVAHSMEIRRKAGAGCVPGAGTLVVGLSTYASFVQAPLYGSVGFKSDGNILTRADGRLDDVDSRLSLPNRLEIAGPDGGSYRLRPSPHAYFNNHDDAPPQEQFGWINLYGMLDLPYFQDMPVHVQTSATRGSSNAPVHITGGWTDEGGTSFERSAGFDPDHRSYPTNTTIAAYRSPEMASDQQYRPRARQRLLQLVPLEYPLAWDAGTRSFRSSQVVENELLLLNVKHQVKYLGARNAEIAFGAQYDGLPRINLANLVLNALPDGSGVASTLSHVIGQNAHQRITAGLGRLDEIMGERLEALLEQPLDDVFNDTLDGLEAALRQRYASVQPGEDWNGVADDVIDGFINGSGTRPVLTPLRQRLRGLLSAAQGQPASLAVKLDTNLVEVIAAVEALAGTPSAQNPYPLFSRGSGGTRDSMRNVARDLIRNLAPQHYNESLQDTVGALLQHADPALAQVVTSLQNARGQLHVMRGKLSQDLGQELATAGGPGGADLDAVSEQIRADIKQALISANYQVSSPFQEHTPAELKAQWRARMTQRFMASRVPAQIQQVLRSRFYDLDSTLRQSVDSGFHQINLIMEDAVSASLASLDRHIEPFLSDLRQVMGSGQVNGYAKIVGEAVPELRLDAKLQWRVPDPLEFRGFILIKQKSSEGDRGSCYGPGANVTEVTVGAEDMAIDWLGEGIRADIGAKFTLNANRNPVGLAGYFNQTGGTIRFQTAAISELAAAVALGSAENYLSGHAALDLSGYSVEGGMFFGRTCDLLPIMLIDEDVAEILGEPSPSFTGAYIYGEGEMPIVDYGCAFNISAGVGAGLFYFAEGPTYGGKMMAKVSGEALCLISVKGKIEMIGAKRGDDLTFKGKGRVKGKVGWCPFCKRFKKTVTLTYKNRGWDADY